MIMRVYRYLYISFFLFFMLFGNTLYADTKASINIPCEDIRLIQLSTLPRGIQVFGGQDCTNQECHILSFFLEQDGAKKYNRWLNSSQGYVVDVYINKRKMISSYHVPDLRPRKIPYNSTLQTWTIFHDGLAAYNFALDLCVDDNGRSTKVVTWF